jgi:hypothetical protein
MPHLRSLAHLVCWWAALSPCCWVMAVWHRWQVAGPPLSQQSAAYDDVGQLVVVHPLHVLREEAKHTPTWQLAARMVSGRNTQAAVAWRMPRGCRNTNPERHRKDRKHCAGVRGVGWQPTGSQSSCGWNCALVPVPLSQEESSYNPLKHEKEGPLQVGAGSQRDKRVLRKGTQRSQNRKDRLCSGQGAPRVSAAGEGRPWPMAAPRARKGMHPGVDLGRVKGISKLSGLTWRLTFGGTAARIRKGRG